MIIAVRFLFYLLLLTATIPWPISAYAQLQDTTATRSKNAVNINTDNANTALTDTTKTTKETTVEIKNADELEVIAKGQEPAKKLRGNVILQQEDVIMECDSAIFLSESNLIEAYGNVHIQQGDSVDIFSQFLLYNGNTKIANLYEEVYLTDNTTDIKSDTLTYNINIKKAVLESNVYLTDHKIEVFADSVEYFVDEKQSYLFDNVRLTDGKMEITSQQMEYNVNQQEGAYKNGGKLVDGETTLISQTANYYGYEDKVAFTDSVELTTPDYQLQTQQLDYDINEEMSEFNGPSLITGNDGSTIQSNKGTYDPNEDKLRLKDRITLTNDDQQLTANELDYDKQEGVGFAKGNVVLVDTSRNVTLKSQTADFYDKDSKVVAYDQALLMNVIDGDTLYMTADTLISISQADTTTTVQTDSVKTFFAYRNVKILKTDLQGVCDSLFYSLQDSVFRMYYNPIVWSENYQMNADTLLIYTINNEVDRLHLLNNAYMAEEAQTGIYSQIKGKNIKAFFSNNNIDSVRVEGNAESIYYIKNEQEEFEGLNKAISRTMLIYFAKQQVDKIKFIQKPEASFHPMSLVNPNNFILKGFKWHGAIRPKALSDLILLQ